jgi:16S rRNA processing protein RimM
VTGLEPSLLLDRVTVAGVERAVVRRDGTVANPILRLEGIDTRDAIVALRGEPLLVDRVEAPPLEEDEYYAADLVGCAVVDGERPVGEVDRVIAYPSCEVLVVGPLLIPIIDDAVRSIDLGGRVIDVSLEFLGEG